MTTSVSRFRILTATFVLILFGLMSVSSPTVFAADSVKPYPLDYCIMDGKPLGPNPVTFVYKGQEIKVDEGGCKGGVYARSGPANLKKVQKAAKSHKKAPAKG